MTGMGEWWRATTPLLRAAFQVLVAILAATAYLVGVVLLVLLVASAVFV